MNAEGCISVVGRDGNRKLAYGLLPPAPSIK